jgi:hypothetical protein
MSRKKLQKSVYRRNKAPPQRRGLPKGDKTQGEISMQKEVFVRWNNGHGHENGFGGTLKIEIYTLDRFAIKKVSGSSIPTVELIRLLWSNPIFEELRQYVSSLKRQNTWGIKMRTGMSGCSDYWIQFLDPKSYSVRQGRKIFHSSMMGSVNEDFVDVWVKDMYDLFWWFKQNHYYEEAFSQETQFVFEDVTERYVERRTEFFKDSYEADSGFGGCEPIDEDKLYGCESIDYSNYTPPAPTDEKDEDEYV